MGCSTGSSGAVAALVLFWSGARVTDVGLPYSEREQLQSGADAASFRVAMDCVRLAPTTTPCTAGGEITVAVTYAQRNALDTKAAPIRSRPTAAARSMSRSGDNFGATVIGRTG